MRSVGPSETGHRSHRAMTVCRARLRPARPRSGQGCAGLPRRAAISSSSAAPTRLSWSVVQALMAARNYRGTDELGTPRPACVETRRQKIGGRGGAMAPTRAVGDGWVALRVLPAQNGRSSALAAARLPASVTGPLGGSDCLRPGDPRVRRRPPRGRHGATLTRPGKPESRLWAGFLAAAREFRRSPNFALLPGRPSSP